MTSIEDVRRALRSTSLMERLAALEHERWAHWQKYVHDQCAVQVDGSLVIPAELVRRWSQQMATEYAKLSLDAQKSDQEQVERYLPTIIEELERQL